MTRSDSHKITYRDAGVDISKADSLIRSLGPDFKRTSRPGQIELSNGFAGLFEIPKNFLNPVLVSTTDGVGTKLKLAFELNKHDTVGIDLVAMCVNDIVVYGASPLYMLDYFATGKIDEEVASKVIRGIIKGCELSETALIGGETAEMPDMYPAGEYDLAGFCVGIVDKSNIIDGSQVSAGDVILGFASSGVHSNGFSLIRKLIADYDLSLSTQINGAKLGEVLLTPTKIYVDAVKAIVETGAVHGLAHITGGGIPGNVERIIPRGLAAKIDSNAWTMPHIFSWIQRYSKLSQQEMFETFNCGIGMLAIVSSAAESDLRNRLDKVRIPNYRIGEIVQSADSSTIFK